MLNEALEAVIKLDVRVLWTPPKFLFLPDRADTLQANSTAGQTDTVAAASSSPLLPGTHEQRQEWARQIRRNPGAVDVQIGDPQTQLARHLRRKVAEALQNPQEFVGGMINRGPYTIFPMLPVFAFLLKLLGKRLRRVLRDKLVGRFQRVGFNVSVRK